uniref:Uncharacterized protein n=1 Tax=Branchiostoma floridae TaxID=7739 RepID=C3YIQ4_BRAFL|eukprot:XP_002603767.1 hypothetical protein BRAFLDRAFT_86595 [Branchiostoma floridae]
MTPLSSTQVGQLSRGAACSFTSGLLKLVHGCCIIDKTGRPCHATGLTSAFDTDVQTVVSSPAFDSCCEKVRKVVDKTSSAGRNGRCSSRGVRMPLVAKALSLVLILPACCILAFSDYDLEVLRAQCVARCYEKEKCPCPSINVITEMVISNRAARVIRSPLSVCNTTNLFGTEARIKSHWEK